MTEYVPFKLDDDSATVVLVEVQCNEPKSPVYRGMPSVNEAITHVGEQAKISLSSAMDNIKAGATVVLAKLKEIEVVERPSRIELEFGIKLDATAGAVVAQAGAEVNYTVKITWENPPQAAAPAPQKTRKRSIAR